MILLIEDVKFQSEISFKAFASLKRLRVRSVLKWQPERSTFECLPAGTERQEGKQNICERAHKMWECKLFLGSFSGYE